MPPEVVDNGYEDSNYSESRPLRGVEISPMAAMGMAFLKRPWIAILTLFVVTIPAVFYIYSNPPKFQSSAVVSTIRPSFARSMGFLASSPELSTGDEDNFYTSILESYAYRDLVYQRFLEARPDLVTASDSVRGLVELGLSYYRKPRVAGFLVITALGSTPQAAHFLALQALAGFQELSGNLRRQEVASVAKFIDGQLNELNRNLGESEAEIQTFLRDRDLTSNDLNLGIDAELRMLDKQLSVSEAARDIAKLQIDAYSTELDDRVASFIRRSTDAGENDRILALRSRMEYINSLDPDSLSKIDSLHFAGYQAERRQLLGQILQSTSGGASGGQENSNQISIRALETVLEAQLLDYEKSQIQCNYYQAQIDVFHRSHPDLPNDILEFYNITRNKNVLLKTIDILVGLRETKRIEMASETGGITVIDNPTLPKAPISQRRLLKLLAAIFGGLGLGFMISYFVDMLDNTVQGENEIQSRFGLAVLGSVPVLETSGSTMGRHSKSKGRHSSQSSKPVSDVKGEVNMKQLDQHPEASPISEAYRAIKTSVLFTGRDRGKKTFVLTSPVASDGKSLTTYNIGVSAAQAGLRVLIMDADLRRASQHKLFKCDRSPGLSDCLLGTINILQGAFQSNTTNLHLLPAGTRVSNPGELVSSHTMRQLIEEAEKLYDIVLIDTPPITPCMDSRHLALMVGGMIMVVRAERTKLNVLEHCINLCRRVNVEILGVIVNHATFRYGYGYYYLYQRYNPYGYYYSGYQYYYSQDPESGDKVRKKRRKTDSRHSYSATE